MRTGWKVLLCLLLGAVTLGVFFPVGRHEFINFDDPDYVVQNPMVNQGLSWPGAAAAFTRSHSGNWHPLTWLSHMVDCQLFGLNAGGHHWVNVAFHAANTVLLFLLLAQLTGGLWRSAFVAGLFALHPLHVESVAWVAERKDVLSAFFFLLTLLAYAKYVARGEGRGAEGQSSQLTPHAPRSTLHASPWYILSLLLFALGLMSKPMLVTLPLVLLLLDYWPLQRFSLSTIHSQLSTLLLEKLPFCLLAGASALTTFVVQYRVGTVSSLERVPLGERLGNAVVSCVAYLWTMLWPRDLSIIYPLVPPEGWRIAAAGVVLLGISALALRWVRSRPWLLVGWLWFLVMLLPVIGLVQVGSQARADRYTYLPLVGVFVALTWTGAEWLGRTRVGRWGGAVVAVGLLSACVVGTRFQLPFWQNTMTLFGRALVTTTRNAMAHYNLGAAFAEAGQLEVALQHYAQALEINPAYGEAHNNLGCILAQQGKPAEARTHFERALALNPRHSRAHRNLGNILAATNDFAGALPEYTTALRLTPEDREAQQALALALAKSAGERLPDRVAALRYLSTGELRLQVAVAWDQAGALANAAQAYRQALELKPEAPEILNNLAWLLATCPDEAVRDGAQAARLAERACELTGFQQVVPIGTLGAAYAAAGRWPEAVSTAEKACALAAAGGNEALLARNRELLELYRSGRAYSVKR
jgi:protein O-mannosyl-transferase